MLARFRCAHRPSVDPRTILVRPRRSRSTKVAAYGLLGLANIVGSALLALAGEELPFVPAPPNHAILSTSLNGWYFVPKAFKQNYDATLTRLEALQSEVEQGRVSAKDAQEELTRLKTDLEQLRKDLESTRVHITGAKIHEQVETIEFDLGPERLLAVTTNHVEVVGWEGPQVKCELRKLVLSTDDEPADSHLEAMKIVHKVGRAEFAGKPPQEAAAEEAKFLASDGAKLNDEQRARRRELVEQIQREQSIYSDYQGKSIDQLTMDGLGYQENEVITLGVRSDGGDGQFQSIRRRYAILTVYVPTCNGVCVRGALRGLLVRNLVAPLVITPADSTDQDHRGKFEVHDLRGNLTAQHFPLRVVENVAGRVHIDATEEFGVDGGGTGHRDGLREIFSPRPLAVKIHGVTEGVQLWYGRVRLDLQSIGGAVDIRNDFGDTRLVLDQPLPAGAHRIVSESGAIDVEFTPAAEKGVPVVAATSHGRVRTNWSRETFDDFHLHGPDQADNSRRNWSGCRTTTKDEDRFAVFSLIGRFRDALDGKPRTDGLDLISRSGKVVVTTNR